MDDDDDDDDEVFSYSFFSFKENLFPYLYSTLKRIIAAAAVTTVREPVRRGGRCCGCNG